MSTNVNTDKKAGFLQGFAGRASMAVKKDAADPALVASEAKGKSPVIFESAGVPRKPVAVQPVVSEDGAARKIQSSKLTEYLIEQEIVTRKVIQEALEIQANSIEKKRLIEILMDDLGGDRESILKAAASYYSFESVDPTAVF